MKIKIWEQRKRELERIRESKEIRLPEYRYCNKHGEPRYNGKCHYCGLVKERL